MIGAILRRSCQIDAMNRSSQNPYAVIVSSIRKVACAVMLLMGLARGLNCTAASHLGHGFHGAGSTFHSHAFGGHSFHGGRSVFAFDFGFGYPSYFSSYNFGWPGYYPYYRFGYYPLYDFTPVVESSLVAASPIYSQAPVTQVDQVTKPASTSAIAQPQVAEIKSSSGSPDLMTSANRLFGR